MTGGGVLDDLSKAANERGREAGPEDSVAGVMPVYVAVPSTTDEVSEVLRVAAHHDLCVVARGAGTKQDWGLPPRRLDLVLDTSGLSGVVEHAAGDLIAIVRAGTGMAELQRQLAESGQHLALDVPVDGSTVGGTVATNASGPRRLLYGTVRDLLIGITFVRADGVVAHAGGKVVKNVAGYDFGKLLAGSYGTLGVITEVVFRLHPVPAARRWVTAAYAGAPDAAAAAARVVTSQLVPSAVEVDAGPGGPVSVAVLVEGTGAGVDARAEAVARLLGTGEVAPEPPRWFGRLPFGAGGVGLKVTSTMTGVGPLLAELSGHGAVRGSACGVLYAGLSPENREAGEAGEAGAGDAARLLDRARGVAAAHGGTVTVLTAPPDIRGDLDMWGPVPGLDLMRRLKDELDPARRLAPGRFVGGI